MASRIETLVASLRLALGDRMRSATVALDEVTVVVGHDNLLDSMRKLRDHADLAFDMMVDLSGVDYSAFGKTGLDIDYFFSDSNAPEPLGDRSQRYAVVYHLLSLKHNWRVRVRSFAPDDSFPVLPSVIDIWPCANWYEREAFDFFGIVFT